MVLLLLNLISNDKKIKIFYLLFDCIAISQYYLLNCSLYKNIINFIVELNLKSFYRIESKLNFNHHQLQNFGRFKRFG